jgi:HD-GYP domain-containing protein (c-di-GMP phosphodiesterase class II)
MATVTRLTGSNSKTRRLLKEVGRGEEALVEMIHVLVQALEERDEYTKGHSERVATLAVFIGKKMGLEPNRLERLERGALLHDVGKIGIRDDLLYKNAHLDPEERARMNQHPEKGHFLILNSHLLWDLIPIVRGHHENFDGSGYPDGLKGEQILLETRIVSLSDYFDALATERPYKEAYSKARSIEYVESMAGKKFDPKVVQAFLAIVDRFYDDHIKPLGRHKTD